MTHSTRYCDHGHLPDSDGWRLVPPQTHGETGEPAGWQLRGAVCGGCGEDLVRAVFVGSPGIAARASAWVTTEVFARRSAPPPQPVRPEPRPCVECGQPIQRGQIYLIDGPKHISCSSSPSGSAR